jgi:rhodanese-related sulfurtransferase
MRKLFLIVICASLALAGYSLSAAAGGEIPRMTPDRLASLLGSPDLVILDVRTDWDRSDEKIKGSVREEPGGVLEWAAKYPKDKKIVLYCT